MVKVHHLRRHLQNHGLRSPLSLCGPAPNLSPFSVPAYKEMYGSEFQYVLQSYHMCGICNESMLFDLDTLYGHINSCHDIKIKEYVQLYLTPATDSSSSSSSGAVDADGAPVLKRHTAGAQGQPRKKVKTSTGEWKEISNVSFYF